MKIEGYTPANIPLEHVHTAHCSGPKHTPQMYDTIIGYKHTCRAL